MRNHTRALNEQPEQETRHAAAGEHCQVTIVGTSEFALPAKFLDSRRRRQRLMPNPLPVQKYFAADRVVVDVMPPV
jgi:hypothetical protein